MAKHLQRDLDFLQREIMSIASMVEEATNKALLALVERRTELAEEVIREDDRVDRKEVQIEEECLKVLALHQPVANDLRFIITVIKVNDNLERTGDLAAHIAKRARYLSRRDPLPIPLDFPGMADSVRTMLRMSLDALATADTTLAREVLAMDDEVDQSKRDMTARLRKLMKEDPETTERALQAMSVARHLERIGDMATNMAEDVVYMVEGDIIRHNTDDSRAEK